MPLQKNGVEVIIIRIQGVGFQDRVYDRAAQLIDSLIEPVRQSHTGSRTCATRLLIRVPHSFSSQKCQACGGQ